MTGDISVAMAPTGATVPSNEKRLSIQTEN